MTNKYMKLPSYSSSVVRNDPLAAALFNATFGREGGLLLDPVRLSQSELTWYRLRYWDYLNKYATVADTLRGGYFGYLDNEALNAMATRDEIALIGINHGAVINITVFFFLLLSHPDTFPSVGDPERETPWAKSLSRCDWRQPLDNIVAAIDYKQGPPPDWPIDPRRKAFAAYLATFALDFLFFHEMGHIVNRHIEYDRERGSRVIHEAVSKSSRSNALDDRALELNADSFAVAITLSPWLDETIPVETDKEHVFSTPVEALVAWTLACGFLFLLFDPHPNAVSAYKKYTHPHPAVRLTNIFMGSCQMARRRSELALARIERAWEGAFKEFGNISAKLEIPTSLWYAVHSGSKDMIREYQNLGRHLQKLFPKLSKFGTAGWQLFPVA